MVARQLEKLRTPFVFTGGAVVGLLLTDSAAPDVRPTDDVDVIVGITTYSDYASLQEELRRLDFMHDMDGPNCRFILNGLKVDVMPSEGKVLGFTNRWYDLAMRSAICHALPHGDVRELASHGNCSRASADQIGQIVWAMVGRRSRSALHDRERPSHR